MNFKTLQNAMFTRTRSVTMRAEVHSQSESIASVTIHIQGPAKSFSIAYVIVEVVENKEYVVAVDGEENELKSLNSAVLFIITHARQEEARLKHLTR